MSPRLQPAIAVDLLRYYRGENDDPNEGQLIQTLRLSAQPVQRLRLGQLLHEIFVSLRETSKVKRNLNQLLGAQNVTGGGFLARFQGAN